jgi:hypothetical protein
MIIIGKMNQENESQKWSRRTKEKNMFLRHKKHKKRNSYKERRKITKGTK